MSNPFQRLRSLRFGPQPANGTYPGREGPYGATGGDDTRPVFTALDIGTAYAKALIIEVQDDVGVVLGVGRHTQSYSHMSDGIVTDIPGVIANCNEALIQAEQSAGGGVCPLPVTWSEWRSCSGRPSTTTTHSPQ